mmetsp:Transcript_3318/g.7815  ORF Transcript_3318/g.7815 Transcript_3318/m.7815 type:complete len:225 (+) Transcript_3318:337-1011(+)|eukprot:CAMPEP_0177602142 /NCGR_PEP_ID=MMETSP0419_2-20121207/14696_1 /TAXON_ID=582737 /ORGANISM="Tetraselmis sp., Strain GSL018" /LENGTH=224 /DNA_ID=CAMNT_0019095577 /DNA_START=281 /DNA_END=955 /DNA_ORIENTATION=+
MSDLAGLHSQAKRLILSLRSGLERLEAAEAAGNTSKEMSSDMRQKLNDLTRISQQMDSTWRMQTVNEGLSKKNIWKRKVEHVTEESDNLRMALERFAGREALRSREAAERDELFRRTALGAESISEIQPDGGEDAAIQGSIANSKRALEDAFAQGAAILTDMAAQRERLKATKRKVLDVLSSVGLSDSLLRMIDRRQRLDMIIVYGGMLLTLLLLIGLWWVFKA